MKNILFISDDFLGGGLETRIIGQIKTLKNHDIKAFLLCHKFNNIYKNNFTSVSDTLTFTPINKDPSAQSVLHDVDAICNFCLENDIDYIDCHPCWCALPAALAAERLHIPISFTLHGERSANFINKEHLAAQSLYDVIFSYGFDQIFAVAEYLTELYSYLPNIEIVRNGLPINSLSIKPFKNTKKVAIASRLDEVKANLIIDFLPTLYKTKTIEQIDIYGDGNYFEQLQVFITKHNMTDRVNLCGWTKDFTKTIETNQYMLAFGMGRVVLEAMKAGIPVGILGYGGFAGLINHNNLADFSKNNLTSWQEPHATLSVELKKLFKKPSDYIFSPNQLSIFNIERIWQKYFNTVSSLSHKDNPIIHSLYTWLYEHPSTNIFDNQELLLISIRALSDGKHPISQRLFYNTFQYQFDEIHSLSTKMESIKIANRQLKEQLSLSLREITKKRFKHFIRNHK